MKNVTLSDEELKTKIEDIARQRAICDGPDRAWLATKVLSLFHQQMEAQEAAAERRGQDKLLIEAAEQASKEYTWMDAGNWILAFGDKLRNEYIRRSLSFPQIGNSSEAEDGATRR